MRVQKLLRTRLLAACTGLALAAGAAMGQLKADGGFHWDPDEVAIAMSAPLEAGWLYLRRGVLDMSALSDLRFEGAGALLTTQRGVIAFDGPLTGEQRGRVAEAGIELGEYLPAFAYHVDLRVVHPQLLANLEFVRWVGRYDEAWKIDPEVGRRVAQTSTRIALSNAGLVPITITLFPGESLADVEQALINIGAEVHQSEMIAMNETVTVTMPLVAVDGLRLLSAVQYVEEAPEIVLRNNGSRWVVQSNQSGVTPLYSAGLRGEGQIVGILDDRVDRNHCSFSDSAPIGAGHRKIQAYNTSFGAGSHGTHVAGTVVGDPGSNTSNRGVAYLGRLVYHTIPSFNETGIRNRLITHHNQGARVHTNSWGDDSTGAYNSLARGFDSFSRDYEESLPLLAVSNGGIVRNPENAKNLLAVGATSPPPNQHQHCTGGAGPTLDGRRKPEIYAPGCSTVSSRNNSSCNTRTLSGTSMATPAVAGVAMLARQYYTQGYYPTGQPNPSDAFTPSAALLKATLLNSATDMTGVSGYPSNLEGWGRVLARDTLHLPGSNRNLAAFDVRNVNGMSTNHVTEYQIVGTGSTQRLKFTLVWTDVPATAGAGFASVNDLDLEVIAPNGALYRGNVFSGGSSVTGGSRDDRNNVEQVHINNPAQGTWTARVKGTAVNSGLQGYALVISGQLSLVDPEPPPPPPANDLCVDAITVGNGVTSFDTLGAGTDGPTSFTGCGSETTLHGDVWYEYVAECDGVLTIAMCSANFDARVRVYAGLAPGSCPTAVTPLFACVNDCGGYSDVVSAGTRVLIRVGALSMNSFGQGSFEISVECDPDEPVPPPANDLCVDAITVGNGVTSFDTLGAGTDGPTSFTGCGSETTLHGDVWYEYVAECDGVLTIAMCSANFDARVRVYAGLAPGSCPTAVTPLFACVNDCGGYSDVVSAGTRVLIRVGALSMNSFGQGSFEVSVECDPDVPGCPGDFDGSGVVDSSDLLVLLSAWGPCPGCPEDLDDSGAVDSSDLLILLGSWGACP